MKKVLPGSALGLLAFLCVQMFRPAIPDVPSLDEIRVPANVKAVLEKDCYSCHSLATIIAGLHPAQIP